MNLNQKYCNVIIEMISSAKVVLAPDAGCDGINFEKSKPMITVQRENITNSRIILGQKHKDSFISYLISEFGPSNS